MSVGPALPGLPPDAEGPVFAEPWQAQAFAMAVALQDKGLFAGPEWAEALAGEIARAGPEGAYWDHWLEALETLVVSKGAATTDGLESLRCAWDRAARATPHGSAIELANDPLGGRLAPDARGPGLPVSSAGQE